MSVTSTQSCPVCQQTDLLPLVDLTQVPVFCNVLWPTQEESINAPRGNINLVFCQTCGHTFNTVFNPELMTYTQAYENSLHFSPRFQNYAEALVNRLIKSYNLHHKHIIEIGCGQGDFLRLICELGQNQGVGFDRSYLPEPNDQSNESVTFIQDFYSAEYADYQADMVACRHVLEHIPEPTEFLTTVREAVGNRPDTLIFFEVPNALFTLRDLAIWDIIYEHCSYYSHYSLSYLFTQADFKVLQVTETYAGQFLCLEAHPGHQEPTESDEIQLNAAQKHAGTFAENYQQRVGEWQDHIQQMADANHRAVIWGSGSKGVTFLNILQAQDQIAYAIDINPRKQGMFIPGTAQQIMPPDFLKEYQPQVIIIMNPIYKDEINQLVTDLGLSAKIMIAT